MTKEEYPHVRAAFINAIREEGTKEEACNYLQEQWNECCALKSRIRELEAKDTLTRIDSMLFGDEGKS